MLIQQGNQEKLCQRNITHQTGLPIRRFYQIKQVCQICTDHLLDGEIIRMNCGDTFHKSCILELLKNKITENCLSVLCPSQGCQEKLSWSLLIMLGIEKQYIDAYFKFQLEQLLALNPTQLSCCPTPGCPYIFKLDQQGQPTMYCQLCDNLYCLNCQSEGHPQFTCKEYQLTKNQAGQEQAFLEMMKSQHCRQCIRCRAWILKSRGCNHMTCRCGAEFCYRCGRSYRHPDCRCPLFDPGYGPS